MASRPMFKGSICKSGCGGHRAGYRYAKAGGGRYSPHSSSFNKGMRIAQGLLPKRKKR